MEQAVTTPTLMPRVEVVSRQIKSIGHDPATNKMHVEFVQHNPTKPTSVYEYDNVSTEEHQALMAAESIGGYFNKHFKYGKPYRKLS